LESAIHHPQSAIESALRTPQSALPAAPLRPPLKWAGGKRWQLPHVRALWAAQSHRRLVEPFCGGLAVAIGLRPARALLNDINPHVINFYRWVQRGLILDAPMRNSRRHYYESRTRFNELLEHDQASSSEAAALFYYLNRTGYNGLCRFNSSGRFNVPFGRYKTIVYRRDFADLAAPLGAWEFSSVRFDTLALEDADFVYADPPYDVEFTQYAKGGFVWDDQVRTAEWLSTHPADSTRLADIRRWLPEAMRYYRPRD